MVELTAWVAHRRRRVAVCTATKNQLTGQVDRCFPGLGACLSSVCDAKVGRLVIAEFADPARLVRLGVARFPPPAATFVCVDPDGSNGRPEYDLRLLVLAAR